MQQISLNATYRKTVGKSAARKLRAQGQIPAVIYKAGQSTQILSISSAELNKILRRVAGNLAFLSLTVEQNPPRIVLLKKITYDHMRRHIIHIDFYEVHPNQKIILEVALEYIGEAKGIKLGGIINIATYKVTLRGSLNDLPNLLSVDISGLELGQAIYISALPLPSGVEAIYANDYLLASCTALVKTEAPLTSKIELEKTSMTAKSSNKGSKQKQKSNK